jgi:hypothetical protein
MVPAQIAETYLHLAQQHRSTWTFEIDIRALSDRAWRITEQSRSSLRVHADLTNDTWEHET